MPTPGVLLDRFGRVAMTADGRLVMGVQGTPCCCGGRCPVNGGPIIGCQAYDLFGAPPALCSLLPGARGVLEFLVHEYTGDPADLTGAPYRHELLDLGLDLGPARFTIGGGLHFDATGRFRITTADDSIDVVLCIDYRLSGSPNLVVFTPSGFTIGPCVYQPGNVVFSTPDDAAFFGGPRGICGVRTFTTQRPHQRCGNGPAFVFRPNGRVTLSGYQDGPCGFAFPRGACCVGTTCQHVTQAECAAANGTYLGDSTICGPATCQPPTGACCGVFFDPFLRPGSCRQLTRAQCVNQRGNYRGDNISCATAMCPQVGGCCLPDGSCEATTRLMCLARQGVYYGDGIACPGGPCSTVGACCIAGQPCQVMKKLECEVGHGGTYLGDRTSCVGEPCDPAAGRGACCALNGTCTEDRTQGECQASGGLYQGNGTVCAGVACAVRGACCVTCASGSTCFEGETEQECSQNHMNLCDPQFPSIIYSPGETCGAIACGQPGAGRIIVVREPTFNVGGCAGCGDDSGF